MFLDNKRENNDKWDLYKYADIKMGVLMVHDGQSMIVEVQFLLDFMLKAKSLGHGLYEIERDKDFIHACYKIFEMDNGDLDAMIRSACMSGDENKLATLLLREAPVDIVTLDDNKKATIHIACERGHKKILKFLLDTKQADGTAQEFKQFINLRGYENATPAHYCIEERQPDCLRLLLKYQEVDRSLVDDMKWNLLFAAAYHGFSLNSLKAAEIWEMVKADNQTPIDMIDKYKHNLMHQVVERTDDLDYLKKLWSTGHFSINVREWKGSTYFMLAAECGRLEIAKWARKELDSGRDLDKRSGMKKV